MSKKALLPFLIGTMAGLNDSVMPSDLICNEKHRSFFAGREKRIKKNKISKKSRKINRG